MSGNRSISAYSERTQAHIRAELDVQERTDATRRALIAVAEGKRAGDAPLRTVTMGHAAFHPFPSVVGAGNAESEQVFGPGALVRLPKGARSSEIVFTPSVTFTIPGVPVPKPRMTQRDRWKKRPCVLRYREFADRARASAPKDLPVNPHRVDWVAYLPMPDSWPAKKKAAHRGQLHRQKPDRDNLDKALLDALWEQDCGIARGMIEKCWDDGRGCRVEVTVWP